MGSCKSFAERMRKESEGEWKGLYDTEVKVKVSVRVRVRLWLGAFIVKAGIFLN